jgi:hypothetical protein
LQIISSQGKFIDLFLNALYQTRFSLHRQTQHSFWSRKRYPAGLLQGTPLTTMFQMMTASFRAVALMAMPTT